jgi:hypothetical protein
MQAVAPKRWIISRVCLSKSPRQLTGAEPRNGLNVTSKAAQQSDIRV